MPKKEKRFTANIRGKTIHRADCGHALRLDSQYCAYYFTYDEARLAYPDFSSCKVCRPEIDEN